MADRVGVISQGKLILVEEKAELMRKLGKKQLTLALQKPLQAIPPALASYGLSLDDGGNALTYSYDANSGPEAAGRITELLKQVADAGIAFKDLHTTQSSLEDIFVSLVHGGGRPS
jgi:ABC-2 type transport system ATP-binding protein